MKGIVLDASVALTWCYPDENSKYAYRILDALEHTPAVAPALWAIEVANALVVGERRRRLTDGDISRFLELLKNLSIETDTQTASRALRETRLLARSHHLSAYNATYLELAMREGLDLATLDDRLKRAAREVDVKVLA